MTYKYIKLLDSDTSIAKLIFNRPNELNAMNRIMMDEIIDALLVLTNSESVKVIIIFGEGSNFMAGADIKEYSKQTPNEFLSFQRKGRLLYETIEQSSKPFIAMIDGYALGGGFEIALACDLIISSSRALLGLPEIKLALIPGGGGTQRLAERIGINRAKEFLYTGDTYAAETLFNWGLINKIIEYKNLETETFEFCEKISRRSINSLSELKFLITNSYRPNELNNRLRYEGDICYRLFLNDESKDKINKFINKNK